MLVGQGPSTLNDHLISAAGSLRVDRVVLPPRTFLIATQMLIKLFRTRFSLLQSRLTSKWCSDVQRFENKLQSSSEISAATAAEWAPPLPLLLKENEKFQKFLSLAGKAAIYPVLLIGTQLFGLPAESGYHSVGSEFSFSSPQAHARLQTRLPTLGNVTQCG